MKVSVIVDDLMVMLDGRPVKLDTIPLPPEVRAVQYDGETAEVEYRDGRLNRVLPASEASGFLAATIEAAVAQKERDDAAFAAEQEAWENSWERVRAERDMKIHSVRWYLERHEDELSLGIPTTLSEAKVAELRHYIQALRDVPEQANSGLEPRGVTWPVPPSFVDI